MLRLEELRHLLPIPVNYNQIRKWAEDCSKSDPRGLPSSAYRILGERFAISQVPATFWSTKADYFQKLFEKANDPRDKAKKIKYWESMQTLYKKSKSPMAPGDTLNLAAVYKGDKGYTEAAQDRDKFGYFLMCRAAEHIDSKKEFLYQCLCTDMTTIAAQCKKFDTEYRQLLYSVDGLLIAGHNNHLLNLKGTDVYEFVRDLIITRYNYGKFTILLMDVKNWSAATPSSHSNHIAEPFPLVSEMLNVAHSLGMTIVEFTD